MLNRQDEVNIFYNLLDMLFIKYPKIKLGSINNKILPKQGVYFFFEPNEFRADGKTERIVRIGTHAAQAGSNSILYTRLKHHMGNKKDLTGNHRASVFRELIGYSLINKNNLNYPFWGDRSKKNNKAVKNSEVILENSVSTYIRNLEFTVLEIPGSASKNNDRDYIERNTIALLSNYNRQAIDPCSKKWLGFLSNKPNIQQSGLWNSRHVVLNQIDKNYFNKFFHFWSHM
jgi:hypothetical protein